MTLRSKVRLIRSLELPETVILNFLSDELYFLLRSRNGPRNENEVRVRAARQLLGFELPAADPAVRPARVPASPLARGSAYAHVTPGRRRPAPSMKQRDRARFRSPVIHDETGSCPCVFLRSVLSSSSRSSSYPPRDEAPTTPSSARGPNCSQEGDRLADQGQFTEAVIRYKRGMEQLLPEPPQDPVQARGEARRHQAREHEGADPQGNR